MTETNRERMAAVVVTYNRKRLLGVCLESLLRQTFPLDAIYIVDNCSTDGTYESLLAADRITAVATSENAAVESARTVPLPTHAPRHVHIRYVRLPENTGGAGGFHEGLKRATDARFDWLWLMDDDLAPTPGALATLVAKKEGLAAASDQPFLLNSLVLSQDHRDDDTLAFPLQELSPKGHPKLGVYHWHVSDIQSRAREGLYRWACPFNGTFISSSAVAQIGLPNKDFYIWGDEKDFLWRAARVLDIYTVLDSKVYHPRPPRPAFDWKQYYNIRNMLIVNRHFNLTWLRNLKLTVLSLALGLRHGPRGLALVGRALADGLRGRLGRRDDLRL
ncbi:MAG: glycosyltransferase family 2 protein [Phycisphaerales bacterium]|nr:MAG: glycosyltransferase family 2 protein [Phycisphaerales bacterium]